MMKYLIQHGSQHCEKLLRCNLELHAAYADRHLMRFVPDFETRIYYDRNNNWSKIEVLIRELISSNDGDFLALLDADEQIRKPEVSLEDGLKQSDIAFLFGPSWANSGTVLLRSSKAVRDFFMDLWKIGEVPGLPGVDARLRDFWRECRTPIKFHRLEDRFNYFPVYGQSKREVSCTPEQAVVWAWHGLEKEDVLKEMQDFLDGDKVA